MKNYEIFNKIYGIKQPSVKSNLFINKLLGLNKLSKEEIASELACRQETFYIPNFEPYEEIEKKWLLTDYGKANFDKWYEEGKKTPGDSIHMVYSYIFEEPEIRIRKVLIDTTDKKFPSSKRITYYLDTKEATKDRIKRVTTHEEITKDQ
jgi:hypothetical protein